MTYSCVAGGYPGEGNIDADPLFVDADGGDYRLGSASPCIDAAHGGAAPDTDRDGAARYDDPGSPTGPFARVPHFPPGAHLPEPSMEAQFRPAADMGAYERQEPSHDPDVPRIVYVNAANDYGPWDGRGWATAFADLQQALRVAYLGAEELWVAAGVYRPTAGCDRLAMFRLKAGLKLYGGFSGDEVDRRQRDWVANRSVLTGDLGSPLGAGGNSYHVVVGADGASLDGFVIADGNADGEGFDAHGGGMVNYNAASARVAHCLFTRNRATEGGALYNYNLSSPTVVECEFVDNRAAVGGAMVDRVGSSPHTERCRFVANTADWRGGAVQIDYGSGPQLVDCMFERCTSGGHDGALFLESVAAQLGVVGTRIEGCTFVANTAALRGGAIAAADASDPAVTSCVFRENRAGNGGGGISADKRVTVRLRDCQFSDNAGGLGPADVAVDEESRVLGDDAV